jgi:hypothetical protein
LLSDSSYLHGICLKRRMNRRHDLNEQIFPSVHADSEPCIYQVSIHPVKLNIVHSSCKASEYFWRFCHDGTLMAHLRFEKDT